MTYRLPSAKNANIIQKLIPPDDELISSIGNTAETFDPGEVSIVTPSHPAAGGKTGTFRWVLDAQPFDTIGKQIPDGATVIVAQTTTNSAPVQNLDQVDQMIAGTLASQKFTGTVPDADLSQGADGAWDGNHSVPGNPTGGFAVVGTGQLTVHTAGTYSFALGTDDGGRLRIDLDQNGLDGQDDVIVADREGAYQEAYLRGHRLLCRVRAQQIPRGRSPLLDPQPSRCDRQNEPQTHCRSGGHGPGL